MVVLSDARAGMKAKKPIKLEVTTEQGPFTVCVARNRVHAFGSNGYDVVLWGFSWLVRLCARDDRWNVSIRAGVPRLWSGTQQLVWSDLCSTYGAAVDRAGELVSDLGRGEWPTAHTPVEVPGPGWLAPQSRLDAAARLVGVLAIGGLGLIFPLLGTQEATETVAAVIILLAAIGILSCVFVVKTVGRRRQGARGSIVGAWSPRNLLRSAAALGLGGTAVAVILSVLLMAAISTYLWRAIGWWR